VCAVFYIISIKAVYSQNAQCKAFLGGKFLSSKILIVFDFVFQKWANPNIIITNTHYEPKLPTVEHFKPLSA